MHHVQGMDNIKARKTPKELWVSGQDHSDEFFLELV